MPKKGNKIQLKKKEAEIEVRRAKVSALVLRGTSYHKIADELGCSLGTVAGDMKKIMGRWRDNQIQSNDEWRELEIKRLDKALDAIWPGVEAGDNKTVLVFLRLSERRAKMKGLDAPAKAEVDLKATVDVSKKMKLALEKAYGKADEAIAELLPEGSAEAGEEADPGSDA